MVALHDCLRFQIYALRLLAVRGVNTFHSSLHGSGETEVFVFMSLIYEKSVNAHIIEVFHIIHLAVKHLHCSHFGVLTCGCLSLLIALFLLALYRFGQFGKAVALFLNLLFGLAHNHASAVIIGFTHGIKNFQFFLNDILNVCQFALLAVGYALKYRLRNDNHIPVVVLDFRVEILAALGCAVCFLNSQHLCIGINLLCALHKLTDCCVLHNYHRLACCAETAHFHCRGDKGVGLAGPDLVSKQYRLGRASDYRSALMRTQCKGSAVQLCHLTAEMLGNKLIGN